MFIDLIQRHEQAFYTFVHKVHSKGEGLFDSLMRWIEQFLTLMREGLGERISLEFLLPHTGQERVDIMNEIDSVARYHYLLKVQYEARVRRRFGRTQGQSDADAEDEAAAELVNGVVRDLSFGDLVQGDATELAAEADEADSDSDSSDEEDGSSGNDDSDASDDSSSGSEDSGDGSDTEPARTRRTTPTPTPTPTVSRSHTIGHSPVEARPSHRTGTPKYSLDMPSPSRSRPSGPLRNSRSLSRSRASRDKALPSLPVTKQVPSPTKAKAKKKKEAGPKPPELQHIPKLLPLFVEMVSPSAARKRLESARVADITLPPPLPDATVAAATEISCSREAVGPAVASRIASPSFPFLG